jgi:hypothetical protein
MPFGFPTFDHAPDFPPGLDWVGCARPLTLSDLRGKLVVLDFFTAG